MKKLIFIYRPNGVGKSTLSNMLNKKIANSAWLDSEWCRMIHPFSFNPDTIMMVEKNISYILRSYLESQMIEYLIFCYGFHGPRKKIFSKVLQNISDINYQLIPIMITCSEEENIKRMIKDGRTETRIRRAIASRHIYDGLADPIIDTSSFTVQETVDLVLDKVNYIPSRGVQSTFD